MEAAQGAGEGELLLGVGFTPAAVGGLGVCGDGPVLDQLAERGSVELRGLLDEEGFAEVRVVQLGAQPFGEQGFADEDADVFGADLPGVQGVAGQGQVVA